MMTSILSHTAIKKAIISPTVAARPMVEKPSFEGFRDNFILIVLPYYLSFRKLSIVFYEYYSYIYL